MRIINADRLMQRIKHKLCISSFDYLLDSEKAIINMIESEPSIEMPTWIPCSEKLPDQAGRYLCTVGAAYRNPREMYYAPKDWTTETDDNTWRDTDGFYVHNWFVEAWMPLPEPWKGAINETE